MSDGAIIFQSTLSVRRATCYNLKNTDNSIHISIHALREEDVYKRQVLADRFVLTLINTGAVKPGDFEIRENGGVLLSDSGRKKVLTAWQKKKSDQILHPFLQEKISWGLVPYVQALLLARSLRGDLDDYPPFMWK